MAQNFISHSLTVSNSLNEKVVEYNVSQPLIYGLSGPATGCSEKIGLPILRKMKNVHLVFS